MVLAEEAATHAKALGPVWPVRGRGRDRKPRAERTMQAAPGEALPLS